MKNLLCLLSLLACTIGSARAQSPAARLLVLNKGEGSLVFLDPRSGASLGRVPTGNGPHELAVSSDGKLAFATNYGNAQEPGHTISMIDIASQKELRRIDVAPLQRPHGAAFVDGRLYFTVEGSRRIARYDPAAGKVDWEFETGQNVTHMLAPMKNAQLLFTTNIGSDSVSAIQRGPSGSWTQTVIPVGKGPEGLDLTPDGKALWVAHSRDGGVSQIDTASKRVLYSLDVGTKRSNRLKLTADGKLALITDLESGELVVLDTAQRKVVRRLALGSRPTGILIPPDEAKAYVAVTGDNHIAVVDLKTWQVTKKLATGEAPDGMAWLPGLNH